MILIYVNINPEILINVIAGQLRMSSEAHPQDTCSPKENPLLPQVRIQWGVLGNEYRGMAPCKSADAAQ